MAGARSTTPFDAVARGGHEVAKDGGRRRRPARAAALEHQRPEPLALHEDRVRRPVDGGKGVRGGHHRGMDADRHGRVAHPLGDREEPHDVAHPPRRLEVRERDLGDPHPRDVEVGHLGAERQGGEDRGLLCGVVPVEVRGRVALGEPASGRLGEHVVAARCASRAIVVSRKFVVPFTMPSTRSSRWPATEVAQHPDDRDRPGDRGLVEEVDPARHGPLGQRAEVRGEQRLVRGDDGGPAVDGGNHELAGAGPADELDDDVGTRVGARAVPRQR